MTTSKARDAAGQTGSPPSIVPGVFLMVILFFSSLDTAANTATGHVQQDLLWPRFVSCQTAGTSPPECIFGRFKNLI